MEAGKERFAIYSRKSKFTGKGESIGNQIELCRQYISEHYGKCFADNACIYEDEGFSGGNLERPQFKAMMQEAKKKKFTAVVCYRLDRISRNIGDFANLIEELNDLQISFISIKEQFDTSSPMGRAMMYIASVFSQLERETIAERIRDNMLELSKSGRWLGGNTPTGYTSESVSSVTIDGKVKKAYKLKLIPEEAKLVKLIYEKFLETGSLTQTETFLLQNGYKTKYGRQFSRFAIKGILTNPVYTAADQESYEYLRKKRVDLFAEKEAFDGSHGVIAYNRTLQRAGKTHELKDMEEWVVAVGKHEGVIPGSLWVRVQLLLDQNKSKSYRKPRSNVALLSGILFCGGCGDYMRPKLSGRYNDQGEQVYSYLCTMKEKSRMKCCGMKNVNGNMLDQMVLEEIRKITEDHDEYQRQLCYNSKAVAESRQELEWDISRLQEQLKNMEEEINGLVASLGKAGGTGAEGYIIKQIGGLHKKKEKTEQRIWALSQAAGSNELSGQEFQLLKQALSSFGNVIGLMDVRQKRAAVRTLVDKVIWDGQNVHLYLLGSGNSEQQEPLGDDSK
ncbi:recombinase family protein [Lacrimispora saccharolytica]|uniref:Resolvase domain protein n=1 Tax=Lacrimispora saccharolytica (strain ATCC 35040 / DSM 2544 / NRCC 2533 / WM1) TaxID=610130 RepID=D9R2A2_LACSW|nr:recombinase family protein [Lacrimispora saccharolytica]ADL04752.1 Resolvase domain protein [[Clostridium] saccharolyticum WM1]QRV22003.1 recombinase family protein [Lacrimispora saccharolytica]